MKQMAIDDARRRLAGIANSVKNNLNWQDRLFLKAVAGMLRDGTCRNCEYRSDDFTSACVNADSPHCADFVSANDSCEHFKEKKNG